MTEAIKLGSYARDDFVDLKSALGFANATNYDTLDQPDGTAYQVPASHIFTITKIYVSSVGAGGIVRFGYADDTIANGAGPPTNPIEYSGLFFCPVALTVYGFDVLYNIPASKYPYIRCLTANGYAEVFGKERDV